MRWSSVRSSVTAERQTPHEAEISGVQYDSRRVERGDVFVAMHGGATDGNAFIEGALQRGAAAVITDSREAFQRLEAAHRPALLVSHGRRALAEVSLSFFGHPERKLAVSAVTGTNGKTTTAYLLEQLLASAGRKNLLVGTIETRVAGEVRPSVHTTPESRDLLALFADAATMGCSEVVMEMSSHALAQDRVWGIAVDVGIFTNLTQDHLDFHGSMTNYASAKAKMFAGVGAPPPRVAVIPSTGEYADWMKQTHVAAGGREVMTYGVEAGDFRAEQLTLKLGATEFQFVTPMGSARIAGPLTGRVNVENLLGAACAALARGLSLEQIADAAKKLHAAPGRFQVVPGSAAAGITVVVDYAHTDDALRNLTRLARDSVAAHGGKVITMFGCGGDRDKTKRPKMGRAAGEGSDLVVVTSDNPRSEPPMAIIHEALVGLRATQTPYRVEEDRRSAIRLAIREARAGAADRPPAGY